MDGACTWQTTSVLCLHTQHVRVVSQPEQANFASVNLQVLYLSSQARPDMPKFIEGVPTLVLDYDTDIDMTKDFEAKHYYAAQVKAYFDFVKALRDKKKE